MEMINVACLMTFTRCNGYETPYTPSLFEANIRKVKNRCHLTLNLCHSVFRSHRIVCVYCGYILYNNILLRDSAFAVAIFKRLTNASISDAATRSAKNIRSPDSTFAVMSREIVLRVFFRRRCRPRSAEGRRYLTPGLCRVGFKAHLILLFWTQLYTRRLQ